MEWSENLKAKKRTNGENGKLEQQQNNDKHESDKDKANERAYLQRNKKIREKR